MSQPSSNPSSRRPGVAAGVQTPVGLSTDQSTLVGDGPLPGVAPGVCSASDGSLSTVLAALGATTPSLPVVLTATVSGNNNNQIKRNCRDQIKATATAASVSNNNNTDNCRDQRKKEKIGSQEETYEEVDDEDTTVIPTACHKCKKDTFFGPEKLPCCNPLCRRVFHIWCLETPLSRIDESLPDSTGPWVCEDCREHCRTTFKCGTCGDPLLDGAECCISCGEKVEERFKLRHLWAAAYARKDHTAKNTEYTSDRQLIDTFLCGQILKIVQIQKKNVDPGNRQQYRRCFVLDSTGSSRTAKMLKDTLSNERVVLDIVTCDDTVFVQKLEFEQDQDRKLYAAVYPLSPLQYFSGNYLRFFPKDPIFVYDDDSSHEVEARPVDLICLDFRTLYSRPGCIPEAVWSLLWRAGSIFAVTLCNRQSYNVVKKACSYIEEKLERKKPFKQLLCHHHGKMQMFTTLVYGLGSVFCKDVQDVEMME